MAEQKKELLDFFNQFKDMGEDYEKISSVFEKLNFNTDFINKIADSLKETDNVKDSTFFKSTDLSEKWEDLPEEKREELNKKFADLKNNFGNAESMLKSIIKQFGLTEEKLYKMIQDIKEEIKGTYCYDLIVHLEKKSEEDAYKKKLNDIMLTFFDDFEEEMALLKSFTSKYKTSQLNQETLKELANKFDTQKIQALFLKLNTKMKTVSDELEFDKIDIEKVKEELPDLIPKIKNSISFLSSPLISSGINTLMRKFGLKQKPRESESRKRKRRAKQYRLEAKEKFKKKKKRS